MCSNYEEGYVGLARVISDLIQVHPELVYGCVDVAFGVAVVAEGEKDEIHRFLDAVSQSMTGNVKGDERFESDASSEFESFVALW